jgi:surfeit locus 1 family protein
MTSERPRFPFGLTLAAIVVVAVCAGLGVWQMQRATWKAGELKRIAAARSGPPVPIATALAAAAGGVDVTFKRVVATCLPEGPLAAQPRQTTDNGEWITRALSVCSLSGGRYHGVMVDRGFEDASRGSTKASWVVLPSPVRVVGTLSHMRGDCFGSDGCFFRFNQSGLAPYVLVAEREDPAAPGVSPAPYPDAAGNLEYVGSYAPTWFGLAGVALSFYAAMLWRRYHPKR